MIQIVKTIVVATKTSFEGRIVVGTIEILYMERREDMSDLCPILNLQMLCAHTRNKGKTLLILILCGSTFQGCGYLYAVGLTIGGGHGSFRESYQRTVSPMIAHFAKGDLEDESLHVEDLVKVDTAVRSPIAEEQFYSDHILARDYLEEFSSPGIHFEYAATTWRYSNYSQNFLELILENSQDAAIQVDLRRLALHRIDDSGNGALMIPTRMKLISDGFSIEAPGSYESFRSDKSQVSYENLIYSETNGLMAGGGNTHIPDAEIPAKREVYVLLVFGETNAEKNAYRCDLWFDRGRSSVELRLNISPKSTS